MINFPKSGHVYTLHFMHACAVHIVNPNIASRGGFRGVSEVSRNHSGFSLDDGSTPFPAATTFHEAYTAG